MGQYVVKHAPFVHSGNDINRMFIYTSLVLMIPSIYGVIFFGIRALFVILISIVSCFLSEILFNLFHMKKFHIDNLSFFVSGLILALTMPYKVPYYVVIASAFFSIFIIKLVFGGLGFNKFNPANCGRCLAGVIVPAIAAELYSFVLNEDLYQSLTIGGENTLYNLFAGQSVGGIGTTCSLLIVLCALILTFLKIIDLKIPILAALSYFVVGVISVGLEQSVINMLSGSFIFVSVFMMTDPNTSPDTFFGKVIYAVMFGALSAYVWQLGSLGENTVFVVALFVNIVAPIIDRYLVIKPVIYGGYRNAHKK